MSEYKENETQFHYFLRKLVLALTYTLAALVLLFVGSMIYAAWSADTDIEEAPTESTSALADSAATPSPQPTQEYIIEQMPYGEPQDFGFDLSDLEELNRYINAQVYEGFPGAILMVAKDGHIVVHEVYGYSKKYESMRLMEEFEKMKADTMFDLASLTKIYATTFSIMKLADQGKISLAGKVSEYLKGYEGEDKGKVTVSMLLTHNAGYVKNYYFYKEDSQYKTYDRDTAFAYIKQIPLDKEPGSTYDYNDLNYMLLGMIVEEVSGMRLDEFAETNIYGPLGIENEIMYRPLDNGVDKSHIAASERLGNSRDGSIYFSGIRQYTIQGEVHDENAYYSMDQVSGHAGLFADAHALTVLNQLLLNGGEYGGVRIYTQESVDNWLRTINSKKYQLGFWDAKEASAKLEKYVSGSTFYHNGWTGTATILDKENNLSIILLTNKRHSPCPEGDFQGTDYSIASYTPIIQRVYEAMGN